MDKQTHNWSKIAHSTASPNGTISHWLNNCQAKISSQGIELIVPNLSISLGRLEQVKQDVLPSDCSDAGEAAFTLMRLQRLPVCAPSYLLPQLGTSSTGAQGAFDCAEGQIQPADVLWALQQPCRTQRTWLWKGSSESLSHSKLQDIQFIHCWERERVRLDSLEPVAWTSPDVFKHVNLFLPE